MTTTQIENIPQTWDDSRDVPFFAITARLFSTEFTYGAGVLLASYDDDTNQGESADIDGCSCAPEMATFGVHVAVVED